MKVVTEYSTECSSKTIGATAVNVVHNSTNPTTSWGATDVKVTNLSTTATVFCSNSSSVATSGNNIGDLVYFSPTTGPRYYLSWPINAMQPWWCIASAANTSILVCRKR